jgi:hypothetical protein
LKQRSSIAVVTETLCVLFFCLKEGEEEEKFGLWMRKSSEEKKFEKRLNVGG